MSRRPTRRNLTLQVGAVAVLFLASLGTLTYTGLSVLERETRRDSAQRILAKAADQLAREGLDELAQVPTFPYLPAWDALDDRLRTITARVLARYEGVEGGYFIRTGGRFLGSAFPTEPLPLASKGPHTGRGGSRHGSGPPPREYDLIETQVDASIRKGKAIFVVESVPPSIVAVRTAPVMDHHGEPVAAVWTMTRLVDPLFLNQSVRGYGLAASLALGGIALALVLTFGLAAQLRREAAERDRLQDELRRSERLAAMGKLLAGVAHEVRNPLAGIRAIAQLWRRGLGFNDEGFDRLTEEVDRLEGIVSRLLHFGRAELQEHSPEDLNAVVLQSVRLVEDLARKHHVEILLELAPDLPMVPMASAAILQIFRNLTVNAIQMMPDGGWLKLSTHYNRPARSVEARVRDTGPGLPPEARSHLFEPFFTTKPEGTGLGLATAREIALAHRGDLLAEAPGKTGGGAVFLLTLPLEAPDR